MPKILAPFIDRLSFAYRDRSFFVGLKARLLAAIALLLVVYMPLNIAKNLWLQPPVLLPRIAVNLIIWAVAAACLRSVIKGNLERAGNALALSAVLVIHGAVLVVGPATSPVEPLSLGIQTFAFDLVILLMGIVFASRKVAAAVFAVMVAGHVGFYFFVLRAESLPPSVRNSATVLLREGLLAMGLVYVLGITLERMIEAAHRRSEETLRQSVAVSRNLERLERDARTLAERRRTFLEAQREFISMVSHEFRTPLTTIQGAQYLLERLLLESPVLTGSVAEKTKGWLGLQASGLLTLSRLVDQVLMLNRTEHMTGATTLELQSPGTLFVETVGRFNDSMATPRVVLRIELPSGFEAAMDAGLVKAAAENLISNALKYSEPEDLVRVRVFKEPGGWAVEVADQGRGIPTEDHSSLFQPFFRARNVGTVPGTGLGLAIVQRAVDFHRGRIEFESRKSSGTVFTVHFPADPRLFPEAAPGERGSSAPGG